MTKWRKFWCMECFLRAQ